MDRRYSSSLCVGYCQDVGIFTNGGGVYSESAEHRLAGGRVWHADHFYDSKEETTDASPGMCGSDAVPVPAVLLV